MQLNLLLETIQVFHINRYQKKFFYPGKLQYYRAENEPFLPDSVKWAIRMPDRIAIRELALSYEEESQQ